MDNIIAISTLNDFIFCPASIYFHKLYGSTDKMLFQSEVQINGTKAHETVDNNHYSSKKSIITGLDVYCNKYNLVGKIDIYDEEKKMLIERKKHISKIYEGYVFQLYAQYFAMIEMGYMIDNMQLYSMDDNKKYPIELPETNIEMFDKFEKIIEQMKILDLENFVQENYRKCDNCIYEPACDRAVNR